MNEEVEFESRALDRNVSNFETRLILEQWKTRGSEITDNVSWKSAGGGKLRIKVSPSSSKRNQAAGI